VKGIRLTDAQVLAICTAFRSCFLLNDRIWLFGSRTNLNKRGGDIDLYIETKKTSSEVNASKIRFLTKLETTLVEKKIDLVIKSGNFELPIYNVAKEEGIQLL
jgi:predicted nucleotidyltransferase